MDSKEARELTERVARENLQARHDRVARARAAAPPDKEPLDIERIKKTSMTAALGPMTDDELRLWLEELYYVNHPEFRTLDQLAASVNHHASWS